jgi:hypothetical protein
MVIQKREITQNKIEGNCLVSETGVLIRVQVFGI